MKKLLAMVLALVMTLSLCTVTNAFADDKDINEDYAEAVETLNGMGVFKGYEDGSFKPNGNITRAEVAAIIYRLYTGDVKDKQAGLYAGYGSFSDMAGATWAAGYVGYCANAGFVKGYGNGKFGPSDPVTGYQALAMILRAVGYGKNGEFEGADWELHVAQIAQQVGALKNVKGVSLKGAASRELVAELLFQVAAYVPTVTYTPALGYNQYTTLNGKTENDTLGEINFDLTKADEDDDEFGRPVYSWTNGKTGTKKVTYSTVYAKPLFTFVEATKNCDIYDESGLKKGTELDVYTNSAKKDDTSYTIADNTKEYGKQGRLTEVYEDRIVNIDTYLAEVGKVVAEKTDSRGHVTKAYVLVDEIHGLDKFTDKFETDGFEKGDFVLVTVADGEIQSMVKADAKNAVLTGALGNSKVRIEIQEVTDLDKDEVKVNHTADYQPVDKMNLGKTYTFYFDTYGNVIGAEELATNYAVLDTLYTDTVKGVDTAFGDLYFFDGESKTDVTINEVVGDDAGDFEATAKKNDNYYYTVYAYTVDKDGAYTLDDADFYGADTAEYTNGNKYITVDGERLQLSKDSKILLQTKESPKGTFTQYTGFEKLPSFNGDDVQFTIVDGYVDMIYVYAYELTTRTVFLYDVEGYATKWNDGKPYTTFKALELVDDKLEEVEINLYIPDEWDGNGHSIPVVGLYEITMSDDYIWDVTYKYVALGINKISDDGKRILTDDGLWFNLDDAIVAKYDGTPTKGEVDTKDWTAKDLTEYSIVYVQIDETKHKTDYTYDALVVYDMYVKVPVYVNTKETKDVEYWLKDFNDVTVTLKEYEMIDEAKMDNDDEVIDLTITYYNGETKIGATLDAKGTKVTHAVISYTDVVTGPIEITTGTQDAYPVAKLEDTGVISFPSNGQQFMVKNGTETTALGYKLVGQIKINKGEGDVHVADLKAALEREALGTNYQVILKVMNTYNTQLADSDVIPNDAFVLVQAWDGETVVAYSISVGTENLQA